MESISDLFKRLTGRPPIDLQPCQLHRYQWPDRDSLYYSHTLAGWPFYIDDWREQVVTVVASIASLAAGTRMIQSARRAGYVAVRGGQNKLAKPTVLPRDTDMPSPDIQNRMSYGVMLVSAPFLYFSFRLGLIHYSGITPSRKPGMQ